LMAYEFLNSLSVNYSQRSVTSAVGQSLRSDGDMLTEKMKAAGDDIKHKIYSGVTHEFIAPPSDPPFF
jgi:acetyl esterase/lipase